MSLALIKYVKKCFTVFQVSSQREYLTELIATRGCSSASSSHMINLYFTAWRRKMLDKNFAHTWECCFNWAHIRVCGRLYIIAFTHSPYVFAK